jgi:hypothetical protein
MGEGATQQLKQGRQGRYLLGTEGCIYPSTEELYQLRAGGDSFVLLFVDFLLDFSCFV